MDDADVSGATITDRGSSGTNGTLVNSPTSATGRIKQARSFVAASGQYISAPAVNVGNAFSLAAWVNMTSLSASTSIVTKQYTGARVGYALGFGPTNTDPTSLQFGFFDGGAWRAVAQGGNFTGAIGIWTHVCGTWDGTTAKLYINSSLNNSATPGGSSANDANPIFIGRRHDGSNTIDGLIDEKRIYARALSATEVLALYNFTGGVNFRRTLTNRIGSRRAA
jgi:hypothetical protein